MLKTRERYVHPHELGEKGSADQLQVLGAHRSVCQRKDAEEKRCERDVHGGSCERHHEFLSRLVGHALETRDAAHRIQRDVARADAVPRGGESVPELVEHDDSEDGGHEQHAFERRPAAVAMEDVTERDPGEQDQERAVDVQLDSPHFADLEGPPAVRRSGRPRTRWRRRGGCRHHSRMGWMHALAWTWVDSGPLGVHAGRKSTHRANAPSNARKRPYPRAGSGPSESHSPQPERVADDRNRAEAHRRGRDHRD